MGWISWLCPGIQLKRWLLLFTAGVIVCAFSLALLFNNQVMGMAEELLFRLSYLATGEYGNTVPLCLGIVGMLLGIGIMVYAVRRIVRSIVEAVSPENSDSLLETIFTARKLSSGPAITVVGGGTGLSTLLRGMKYITGNCTAIVSVERKRDTTDNFVCADIALNPNLSQRHFIVATEFRCKYNRPILKGSRLRIISQSVSTDFHWKGQADSVAGLPVSFNEKITADLGEVFCVNFSVIYQK